VHATELRLPGVNRCLTDTTIAGHIIHRPTRFHLFQRSDNLPLRVPALTHLIPPRFQKSYSVLCGSRGAGQLKTVLISEASVLIAETAPKAIRATTRAYSTRS